MTYGLILAGSGLLFLGLTLEADTPTSYLLPVFLIMGHGMGATMAPMTAAVMNAVGAQRAGLGSAMTNTSREVGGVLGIALLGTVLTTQLKDAFVPAVAKLGLTASQASAIGAAAGHGDIEPSLLTGLSPEQITGIQAAFVSSFMDGFHTALVIGGTVLLVAAIVANRFIPGRETVAEVHAASDAVAVAH
jgi:DHA2 family multidrug resistance protein-like MFS transporter